MSPFSWQGHNLCGLSLVFVKDWRVVSQLFAGTCLCDIVSDRLSSALDALDETFAASPFPVSHVEEIKVSWMDAHHSFEGSLTAGLVILLAFYNQGSV